MFRPFFASPIRHAVSARSAALSSAVVTARGTSAARLRGVGRAFNPLEGVPHPIARRSARPSSFAVGEEATPDQERAMRNFWWDGFFAESSEVIWLQFFSLYALVLGANIGLIGVLVAMGNLLAAASMWPGAVLAERTRKYKFIVVLTSGGLGRLTFLLLAAIPWFATGKLALGLIVLAAGMRGVLSSIAMPAWHAFAGEFVPVRLRGRYFASRNFARQMSELATAPLIGLVISLMGGLTGWQTAWLVALTFGIVSSTFYLRIPSQVTPREPAPALRVASPPSTSALRDTRLRNFVLTAGLFQLSVMLVGPFFSIYLVRELGGSAMWVGLTAAAMPVGGMLVQPLIGRLHDQFGAKRLLIASGLLIPVLPWCWIIATEPWHILFVNVLGGALWSTSLLASFNMILAIAPPERRPSYAGLHQAAIFFAAFVGPLAGGVLIGAIGFHMLFFISGAGRVVATLLMWKMVPDDRADDPADERLPEAVGPDAVEPMAAG